MTTAQKISRMLMVDPLCEETDCMTSRPSHRILGFILTTQGQRKNNKRSKIP